jgi:UDP-N-acetylmuramyl pentapeptide synthase
MIIEDFKKACASWDHKSWKSGNLLEYWGRAGLSLDRIYENKEKLSKRTRSVAVLGSVGKTTLSRILFGIIKQKNKSCYLTKVNDNWLPQLPFSVELALRDNAEIFIFECGVASKGDAILMAQIVPADFVVYTEFAEINLSELNNIDGVAKEKIGFALENPSSKIISHFNNLTYLRKDGIENFTSYGIVGSKADYRYQIEKMKGGESLIRVLNKKDITLRIKDIGLHLGSACCGAVCVYNKMGYRLEDHLELPNYTNPRQRMQKIRHRGVTFIVDTANANELSILNSLETVIQMDSDMPKNAVIGEIYELGADARRIMAKVIREICQLKMNVFRSVHFIGSHFLEYKGEIKKEIPTSVFFYLDESEFKNKFNISNYSGQMVLLRGPTISGVNLSNILTDYSDGKSDETTPEEIRRILRS